MTVHNAKQIRAAQLFREGHSCRYVAKVLEVPYKQMTTFRRSLDIPRYDMKQDPSVGRLRRWSGLQLRPPARRANGTGMSAGAIKMTDSFHVKRCSFPMWPHGSLPTQEFCDEHTMQASSYCIRHHAVCYVAGTGEAFKKMVERNIIRFNAKKDSQKPSIKRGGRHYKGSGQQLVLSRHKGRWDV